MRAPKADIASDILAHAKAVTRHGVKCWTCSLPPDLLESIHEARAKGAEIPAISSYLVTKLGYPPKEAARIKNHFGSRHHVR